MLAYYLRMDLGNGRATPLFSACGPCGGGGCLDRGFMTHRNPRGLPYYVGDTWSLRLKVEDPVTHAALNLDDYLIIATFKHLPTDYVGIVRRSDTNIPGTTPAVKQIAIDNQAVDNGTIGIAGRGWFQLNFASVVADFCQMLSLIGEAVFDIRIQNLTTGAVTTLLEWCFGVYEPKTLLTFA